MKISPASTHNNRKTKFNKSEDIKSKPYQTSMHQYFIKCFHKISIQEKPNHVGHCSGIRISWIYLKFEIRICINIKRVLGEFYPGPDWSVF